MLKGEMPDGTYRAGIGDEAFRMDQLYFVPLVNFSNSPNRVQPHISRSVYLLPESKDRIVPFSRD